MILGLIRWLQFMAAQHSVPFEHRRCSTCRPGHQACSRVNTYFLLLVPLRDLRGRPTFRSFTASRSFGSISQSCPTLVAFKRFDLISTRTRLAVTPKRLAASAELMIFIGPSIAFCKK